MNNNNNLFFKPKIFQFLDELFCFISDLKSLQSIVMNSLEASYNGANHPLLDDAQWERALVRASLELEFYHSWTEGDRSFSDW